MTDNLRLTRRGTGVLQGANGEALNEYAIALGITNDLGTLQVTLAPAKTPKNPPIPAPPFAPPAPISPNAIVPMPPPQPAAPPYYPPPPISPAYPMPYSPTIAPVSSRSKVAAGLFALLLPGFGIHRFYLGYTNEGIIFLLLSLVISWLTCGISASVSVIWSIIEGFIILCGGMNDAEGRPLS